MTKYIMRLDDASEYMDTKKWKCTEVILDKYDIKPIVGIIPHNQDESLLSQYEIDLHFWEKVQHWINKGWIPAMHGYEHKYETKDGGINPVHRRSEFAGLPYEKQAEKIKKGYQILREHDVQPEIFFAPSHTFDTNTLKAIKNETPIRIISDTVAWDIYKEGEFWFVPQQSGRVRKIPFKTVTFCYHPNTMINEDFDTMEVFIKKYRNNFTSIIEKKDRNKTKVDEILQKLYLARH